MTKETVKEYVTRRKQIENEIALLKEDKKELDKDFKEKLDLKAVNAALRIAKIRADGNEDLIDSVLDHLDNAV